MVIGDLLSMGDYLAEAAATDPISLFLLAVGHVVLIFSIGLFGVLTLGGIVGALRPD